MVVGSIAEQKRADRSLTSCLMEGMDTGTAELGCSPTRNRTFCSAYVLDRSAARATKARDPFLMSAESIPTLKNRESIHFGFLLRGFVEKELIHDS